MVSILYLLTSINILDKPVLIISSFRVLTLSEYKRVDDDETHGGKLEVGPIKCHKLTMIISNHIQYS